MIRLSNISEAEGIRKIIWLCCASSIAYIELNILTSPVSSTQRNNRSTQIAHEEIQSTLVNSKSKGPSETLRDIRTSTYQICKIEQNTNRTTKFHKLTCNLTP